MARKNETDILHQVHMREESIILGQESEAAMAGADPLPGRAIIPALAVKEYPALVNVLKARKAAEHRGLAGSGRPCEHEGRARRYMQLEMQGGVIQLLYDFGAQPSLNGIHSIDDSWVNIKAASSSGQVIIGQ